MLNLHHAAPVLSKNIHCSRMKQPKLSKFAQNYSVYNGAHKRNIGNIFTVKLFVGINMQRKSRNGDRYGGYG